MVDLFGDVARYLCGVEGSVVVPEEDVYFDLS